MADADFTMMEALMELCQEKHIDQLYLLDRLEAALAETYARVLKLDWGAKVTIDHRQDLRVPPRAHRRFHG